MKAKFFAITLTIVVTVFLVTSCQKMTFLLMFNNCGEEITVISYDDTMREGGSGKIKSGDSGEVLWPSSMTIQCRSNMWKYSAFPVSVPLGFVDTHHGLRNYLKIQVDQDGLLNVLSPSASSVVLSNFVVQSSGFPIKPSVTN